MAEGDLLFRLRKLLRGIDPVYTLMAGALILLFAPVLAGAQTIF